MTDDLEHFDGLESVQLTIGGIVHDVLALRRPLTSVTSGGSPVERAAWHVRTAELAGAEPVAGSVLEIGSQQWTVQEIERLSFGVRYRLLCVRSA